MRAKLGPACTNPAGAISAHPVGGGTMTIRPSARGWEWAGGTHSCGALDWRTCFGFVVFSLLIVRPGSAVLPGSAARERSVPEPGHPEGHKFPVSHGPWRGVSTCRPTWGLVVFSALESPPSAPSEGREAPPHCAAPPAQCAEDARAWGLRLESLWGQLCRSSLS